MKLKRFFCVLLAYTIAVACSLVPANAANKNIVRLEDLGYEQVDMSEVEYWDGPALLVTDSVNVSISKHSIAAVNQPLSLRAGERVTFNCAYSPSSANLDFGLLTSNGRFYSVNANGGSITQTLEISQAGNYIVAIRNNSSVTVSVAGFVEY